MPRRPGKSARRSAYEQALGLLARREHSARELEFKLRAGGQPGDETEQALGRLREQHYQDDERFAASLARRRAAQGYGPLRIQAELKSHGLADPAIRQAIGAAEADWAANAAAQLRRHAGAKAPKDAAERARRAAFLLRRGFDAATVRAVTRAETGDPDEGID
jgi:regulatory protein